MRDVEGLGFGSRVRRAVARAVRGRARRGRRGACRPSLEGLEPLRLPALGITSAVVFDPVQAAYFGQQTGAAGTKLFAIPVGTPGHVLKPVSNTVGAIAPTLGAPAVPAFTAATVYDVTAGVFSGIVYTGKTGYKTYSLPVGAPGHDTTPISATTGSIATSPTTSAPIFTSGIVFDATAGAYFGVEFIANRGYTAFAVPVGVPGHKTVPISETVGVLSNGLSRSQLIFTSGVVYDETAGAYFGIQYTSHGYASFALPVGTPGHTLTPVSAAVGGVGAGLTGSGLGFTSGLVYDSTAGAYVGVQSQNGGYRAFAVPVGVPGDQTKPISNTLGLIPSGSLSPPTLIFTAGIVYDATRGAYFGVQYAGSRGYTAYALPVGTPGHDLTPLSNAVGAIPTGAFSPPKPIFTQGLVYDATTGAFVGLQYANGYFAFTSPLGVPGGPQTPISATVGTV